MNTQDLMKYLLTPVAQVALIMGIAEVCKRLGLNSRWIPLVDLALGILSGCVVYSGKFGMVNSIVLGISLGLSACGLFSGIKNVMEE